MKLRITCAFVVAILLAGSIGAFIPHVVNLWWPYDITSAVLWAPLSLLNGVVIAMFVFRRPW